MLKNLYPLAITIIFTANGVFASGQNSALIQQQSSEIKELANRVDTLEKAVKALTNKPHTEVQNNLEQDPSLFPSPEKKMFFDDKSAQNTTKFEYDLALASLKDGKFAEAEDNFANFIRKYPKDKLQENAVFWYAESFYRRDDFNQAAIQYLKGYKEYPKGPKASDSLLKLALSLDELGKSKEACSILDKLDSEFPNRPANSLKRAGEARSKFGCKK